MINDIKSAIKNCLKKH